MKNIIIAAAIPAAFIFFNSHAQEIKDYSNIPLPKENSPVLIYKDYGENNVSAMLFFFPSDDSRGCRHKSWVSNQNLRESKYFHTGESSIDFTICNEKLLYITFYKSDIKDLKKLISNGPIPVQGGFISIDNFKENGPFVVYSSSYQNLMDDWRSRNLGKATPYQDYVKSKSKEEAIKKAQVEIERNFAVSPAGKIRAAMIASFMSHPRMQVGSSMGMVSHNADTVTMSLAGLQSENYQFEVNPNVACTNMQGGLLRCVYSYRMKISGSSFGIRVNGGEMPWIKRTDVFSSQNGRFFSKELDTTMFNAAAVKGRSTSSNNSKEPSNAEKCREQVLQTLGSDGSGAAAAQSMGCF